MPGMRNYYLAALVIACSFLSETVSATSSIPDVGCSGDEPLVSEEWGSFELNPTGLDPVNTWTLPTSPSSPANLTSAHMTLQLARDSKNDDWEARFVIQFASEEQVGIPFTFQQIVLDWVDSSGARSEVLDWSRGCSGVGSSIVPGQHLSFSFRLNKTKDSTRIESPHLRLWGSRN